MRDHLATVHVVEPPTRQVHDRRARIELRCTCGYYRRLGVGPLPVAELELYVGDHYAAVATANA